MDVSQLRPWEVEQGGERLGHRYHGQHLAALALDPGADVEDVVFQVREGVEAVHDLRRDDGLHAAFEIASAVVAFFGVERARSYPSYALGFKPAAELGADVFALSVERANGLVDGVQLFPGCHAGADVARVRVQVSKVEKTAHAYHKEFVQVAGEDGREFKPLQQWHALVQRLGEHPVVECEPGKLSVLRVGEVRHSECPPFLADIPDSPRARRSCW